MTEHHRCCDCGLNKPLDQFRVRKDRPSGRTSYCINCLRARWKAWAANLKRLRNAA
jgi:hypothetical protein